MNTKYATTSGINSASEVNGSEHNLLHLYPFAFHFYLTVSYSLPGPPFYLLVFSRNKRYKTTSLPFIYWGTGTRMLHDAIKDAQCRFTNLLSICRFIVTYNSLYLLIVIYQHSTTHAYGTNLLFLIVVISFSPPKTACCRFVLPVIFYTTAIYDLSPLVKSLQT